MNLVFAKVCGAVIVVISSLICGLLPFRILGWLRSRAPTSQRRVETLFSCVQCFGAGVLLATVFTHILPDVRRSMRLSQPDSRFPLAEVLLCSGMFTIYLIEELAAIILKSSAIPNLTHTHETSAEAQSQHRENSYGTLAEAKGSSSEQNSNHDDENNHDVVLDHQRHLHMPPAEGSYSGFRVFVVAVALSVHSVFEGVAIGLDSRSLGVWMLVFAIAAHKSILAFCLGEQLASSDRRLRTSLIVLCVFVLASPSGIIAGASISSGVDSGEVNKLLTGVLQGLAAGTILYVVLFEMIQGERGKPGNGIVKLAAVVVGFIFMLALMTLVKASEEKAFLISADERRSLRIAANS